MKLHTTQERLLSLIAKKKGNLEGLSLRKIGELINISERPQVIAHHLNQLETKGYLRKDAPASKRYTILKEPVANIAYINLYEYAECGPDGILGNDDIVEKIPLSTKTFGIANPDDYFLIRARGKSMEPAIHSGDLVLAKRQNHIENGDLAVIVHNDMPKIKKILTKNGMYCLVSSNPAYSDEDVMEDGNDLRVAGKVRSIIKTTAQA